MNSRTGRLGPRVSLRLPWLLAVSALLMLVVASTTRAQMSDSEWKDCQNAFQQAWANAGSASQKVDAIGANLDHAQHPGNVDLLLALQRADASSMEVQAAVFNALATLSDPACVTRLIEKVDATSNGLRLQLVIALGRIANDVRVENAGAQQAYDQVIAWLEARDRGLIAAACEALTYAQRPESLRNLTPLLGHKKDDVQLAAVKAIGEIAALERDGQVVMEPLINLALDRKTKGELERALYHALRVISGFDLGDDANNWANWWSQVRYEQNQNPGDATGVQMPRPKKIPEYYGIPITDKKFVFVVDISGSMAQPISPDVKQRLKEEDEKRVKEKPAGVTTGGDGEGESDEEEDKKIERRPLPWDDIETKLDLAREEFIRAIEDLPEDCFFGVVQYSTAVGVHWDYQLLPATPQNKQKAIAIARTWRPTAMTNIYGALLEAFKFGLRSGRANGSVFTDGTNDDGPDAIFFMTDGSPTWCPETRDANTPGPHVNPDAITRDIRKLNELRRIKIHTIGVGMHNAMLLQQLATDSGGEYRAVGQ